jgi:hypothetical protein
MSKSIFGQSSASVRTVNARLAIAAEKHNLVSPSPSCGALPAGYEVLLSLVVVSHKPESLDVFVDREGRLVLKKAALRRISGAAGLTWRPEFCGRLPGVNHPFYCRYRATGEVLNFDASSRVVSGEVEIDARDGSNYLRERRADPRFTDARLQSLRARIVQNAETAAKERAICDLGLERSYSLADIRRGFAVARVIFTGRSRSKRMREAFALQRASNAERARAALFGAGRKT